MTVIAHSFEHLMDLLDRPARLLVADLDGADLVYRVVEERSEPASAPVLEVVATVGFTLTDEDLQTALGGGLLLQGPYCSTWQRTASASTDRASK